MVAYIRYTRSQTPCRMSSLSSKYSECVRKGKKYEPAVPVVSFAGIDRAMERLEQEELRVEAALEAANAHADAANAAARKERSKIKRLHQ